jgi:hypothetical protein
MGWSRSDQRYNCLTLSLVMGNSLHDVALSAVAIPNCAVVIYSNRRDVDGKNIHCRVTETVGLGEQVTACLAPNKTSTKSGGDALCAAPSSISSFYECKSIREVNIINETATDRGHEVVGQAVIVHGGCGSHNGGCSG